MNPHLVFSPSPHSSFSCCSSLPPPSFSPSSFALPLLPSLSPSQEPGAKFPTEAKIHENQMDLVRLLTSHGGDLNATESTGATPRDLAQQCDFYECADLIDELKGTLYS